MATDSNKALRLISVLREIPREPRVVTAGELQARLEGEGHELNRRSVERYLKELAESYEFRGMLKCDDRERPFGWSFYRNAHINLPGMDAPTAATWWLVGRHLGKLLPPAAWDKIEPHIRHAEQWLQKHRPTGSKAWPDKVASVPRTFPLQPAQPEPAVIEAVYDALYEERQLDVTYKGEHRILHPVGLIDRGRVSYLMAMAFDAPDPFMFATHRIEKAEKLDEPARKKPDFDVEEYVRQGGVDIPTGDEVTLELRFYNGAGEHLRETPLTDNQQIQDEDEGVLTVKAKVIPTEALRWWIQGFADNVEVLKPKKLRKEVGNAIIRAAERYQE
jgi:predicted DNA-binding transcriptional regulator YafY